MKRARRLSGEISVRPSVASLRAGMAGQLLTWLGVAAVIGPFLWILTASFKTQIAIYSAQFPFTPEVEATLCSALTS